MTGRESPNLTRRHMGWLAEGLRLAVVAHDASPSAVHGLVYLSVGGGGWEGWPFGAEIAVGGGWSGSRSYGLLQLSYVAGITSRVEAVVTYQAPVGANVARPEWLSPWLLGLRWGFELGRPERERVIRAPADAKKAEPSAPR